MKQQLNEQALQLLGMAQRARKLATGEELVLNAVREGNVALIILAGDASERTQKTVTNKATYYKVPIIYAKDRYALGRVIGKEARVVVGVTDEGFAQALIKKLDHQ